MMWRASLATVMTVATVLLTSCAQTPPRTWELPVGAKALRVNGYDMAYVERGAGQAIVLVHGSPLDYRYFAGIMEPLSAKYRVISVSLRHYYPEPWDGKGGAFSMRQHASDVAAFVRALGAGPVHLVGHSRGGSLALYAATANPDLFRTLTIAEGGNGMSAFESADPTAAATAQRAQQQLANAVAMFERGKVDDGLAYYLDEIAGPGSWKALAEPGRQALRGNAWTLKGMASNRFDPYSCADAGRIASPVLLLGGEKSPPQYGKYLDAMQSCLRNSERVLIRNAGHGMPRQNPGGFSEAIVAFISKY
ncbi:alpha/beta hydrolase [Variovorax sp. LjRoot84]|uniref:alpha/beta fold hydrolase n=1 Tax=Variovorax sp. LjRoot84 TaxID=3342340 RepID=UPI003ECC41EE